MIQIWRIKPTQNIKLEMDASSLDALTRQLPEGYYSTFRTFAGCTRVLDLAAHLRRLYRPVSTPELSASSLRRQLRALLGPYRPDEARVRAIMTKQGQVYIAIERLKELPREVYESGVRVETTELQRQHPRLKSTTFISKSDSRRKHIALEGIFEALLVKDEKILEGMTSNFFYIPRAEQSEERSLRREKSKRAQRGEILCTARDDILLGVTRKTVIGIARGRGLEVKYEPLKRDQLAAVDESFITSSSRGIVPVIKIDQITIGEGSPGPITKELMTVYEAYVMENAQRI
ncbi:MAG TPA: aminotransferase class IV [Anaerolineales bacterium]|nr:aminotransferase class IV [Anaerolineales bacterium]